MTIKNYENALENLKNSNNRFCQSLDALLHADAAALEKTSKIYEKLIRRCDEFCFSLSLGHENHFQQKAVEELLELLAQSGEKHIERRRDLLDYFRNSIYMNEFSLPDVPPSAWFGEPVNIEYIEEMEMFRVEMLGILPFKMSGGVSFLYDKVAYHMERFSKEWSEAHGQRPVVNPAVVVFIHHYIKGTRSAMLRDYDNLERKRVLDALQVTGLFYDNPAHMVSLDMMKLGDKNYTEVLIAPVHRLKDIVADIVTLTDEEVAAAIPS